MKSSTPVLVAVLAIAVLCGCTQKDPVVIPEPEPSSAPIFESDEEALAAAEVAYGEYLKVSNEITADGGEGAERIEPLVSEAYFESAAAGFRSYQTDGLRTEGTTSLGSAQLQQREDQGNRSAHIVVYACVDISRIRVFNSVNEDVSPANKQAPVPFELDFEATRANNQIDIRLNGSELWNGATFCTE